MGSDRRRKVRRRADQTQVWEQYLDYARKHPREFRAFSDEMASRFLRSFLFFTVLGIITGLNINKYGPLAGYAYLPSILLFFFYFAASLFRHSGATLPHATLGFAAAGSFAVAGASYMVILGGAQTLINAPLQIVLVAVALMVQLHGYRKSQLFFLANVVLCYGTIYYFRPELAGKTYIQPITVMLIGYQVIQTRFNDRIHLFYEQQVNSSQKLILFNELQKKIYPHQMSMIEDGLPLEETMPIGDSTASVMKFDVVGSTEIVHEEFQHALRRFDNKAKKALTENYRAEPPQANGFRLKGTGDGLITTHGFPFFAPKGHTSASIAVAMAERFLEIFDDEMSALDYNEPITASVGIGMGEVNGYHTVDGIVEYDMSGRSIALADRYESLRKTFYPRTEGRHVIVIPEKVFRNLHSDQRREFRRIELGKKGISVRNDRSARFAFVRVIPSSQPQAVRALRAAKRAA